MRNMVHLFRHAYHYIKNRKAYGFYREAFYKI